MLDLSARDARLTERVEHGVGFAGAGARVGGGQLESDFQELWVPVGLRVSMGGAGDLACGGVFGAGNGLGVRRSIWVLRSGHLVARA